MTLAWYDVKGLHTVRVQTDVQSKYRTVMRVAQNTSYTTYDTSTCPCRVCPFLITTTIQGGTRKYGQCLQ